MGVRNKVIGITFLLTTAITACAFADTVQDANSEGKVVETQTGELEMAKYYESIDELNSDAEFVVAGECISVDSFSSKLGTIWTKSIYQVDEILAGSFDKNTVTVYIMGGKIPIGDYLEAYEGPYKEEMEEHYSQYNENDLISQVYEESKIPEVGEKSVLFLTPSSFEGGYERVGSFMGAFNMQASTRNSKEDLYEGYLGNYTIAEIKKELAD